MDKYKDIITCQKVLHGQELLFQKRANLCLSIANKCFVTNL